MPRPVSLARPAGGLIAAAAVANAFAAGATFFVPDLLTGPVVTNAQARGTSLIMLAIGLPTLAVATWLARRGLARPRGRGSARSPTSPTTASCSSSRRRSTRCSSCTSPRCR